MPCVLTCLRVNMSWDSGPHAPACLRYSCPNVLGMLSCSHVNVFCLLMCLRAKWSCLFKCSRAKVPCMLTCSGITVPCMLSCSHVNVPRVLTCLMCQHALRAFVLICNALCAFLLKMLVETNFRTFVFAYH